MMVRKVVNVTVQLDALFDGSWAEVSWQLLGISIPGWVVIGCIPLLIGNLLVLRRQ